jgi:hypothetical protein
MRQAIGLPSESLPPNDPAFFPLPPPAGGRGQGEGADEAVCGAAHLTLPGAVAPRPLPLPLKGGEGLFSPTALVGDTTLRVRPTQGRPPWLNSDAFRGVRAISSQGPRQSDSG